MVRNRSRISKSSELIPTSETIVSKIETPLSNVMEEGEDKREDNSEEDVSRIQQVQLPKTTATFTSNQNVQPFLQLARTWESIRK